MIPLKIAHPRASGVGTTQASRSHLRPWPPSSAPRQTMAWLPSPLRNLITVAINRRDEVWLSALRTAPGQRWRKRLLLPGAGCFVYLVHQYIHGGSFVFPSFTPTRTSLQPLGLEQSALDLERQEKIKKAFVMSYDSYVTYAWGHDEITPVSLGFSDPRNGWGATIIDSLSTLYIMNMDDRLEAAIQHTVNTNFTHSYVVGQPSSVFETTIRYLGGILSAYELTGANRSELLGKAQEVFSRLEKAWIGSSEIPYAWMHFVNDTHNSQSTITIAEAGSLTLEFDRLSFWTGDDRHRRRADATSRHIMRNPQVFPGLHAQTLMSATGLPVGDRVGWGANVDSFLEYAVKYWQLIGEDATDYINYWQKSIDSTIENLLRWSPDGKHPYLAEYSASERGLQDFMTHLACFAREPQYFHGFPKFKRAHCILPAANWMLGGKLLNNEAIFQLGVGLAETCFASYNSTKTGLGPDKFTYGAGLGNQLQILNPEFILRPEVVESIWYAWRLTGDPIWKERAWGIFEALEKHCKVPGGYAGLKSVMNPDLGLKDQTESFLFGEWEIKLSRL